MGGLKDARVDFEIPEDQQNALEEKRREEEKRKEEEQELKTTQDELLADEKQVKKSKKKKAKATRKKNNLAKSLKELGLPDEAAQLYEGKDIGFREEFDIFVKTTNNQIEHLTLANCSLTEKLEEMENLVREGEEKQKKLKSQVKLLKNEEDRDAILKERNSKLDTLPVDFRKLVKTHERLIHKTPFKKCFIGSDAVTKLKEYLHFDTREEALKIGQILLDQGVFKPILSMSSLFEDRHIFYQLRNGDVAKQSFELEKYVPFVGQLEITIHELKDVISHSVTGDRSFFLTITCDHEDFDTRSEKCVKNSVTWGQTIPPFFVFHSTAELKFELKKKKRVGNGKRATKAKDCVTVSLLDIFQESGKPRTFFPLEKGKGILVATIKYTYINGTKDEGYAPDKRYWPLSWVSGDPLRNYKYSASTIHNVVTKLHRPNHRCGVADIFLRRQPKNRKNMLLSKSDGGPGDPLLEGFFQHGHEALHSLDIELFIQSEIPDGEFKSFGSAKTQKGLVGFFVPEEFLDRVGRYAIRMVVKNNPSEMAIGTFYIVEKGCSAVVFDIDGTLTVGDQEVIKQLAFDTINLSYSPKKRKGAVSMVRWWYVNGFLPIYLSGRQGSAYNLTREYLTREGFPPGLIGHTSNSIPTMPVYSLGSIPISGVGDFKSDFMEHLRKTVSLKFAAVYGNTGTDVKVYKRMSCPKENTFIMGPLAKKNKGFLGVGKDFSQHYEKHLSKIEPPEVAAPHDVFDWN